MSIELGSHFSKLVAKSGGGGEAWTDGTGAPVVRNVVRLELETQWAPMTSEGYWGVTPVETGNCEHRASCVPPSPALTPLPPSLWVVAMGLSSHFWGLKQACSHETPTPISNLHVPLFHRIQMCLRNSSRNTIFLKAGLFDRKEGRPR